jgi:lipoprotein-anchoring transpeptidase ErfK/SrfK
VRVYTRFRSIKSKPPRHGGYYWIAVVLGLVFLGWIFWRTQGAGPSQTSGKKASKVQSTNAISGRVEKLHATNISGKTLIPNESTSRPPLVVVTKYITNGVESKTNGVVVASNQTFFSGVTHGTEKSSTDTQLVASVPAAKVHDIFEAQVALSRTGISPGSIDGASGSQTRGALEAFQKAHGLPVTGTLNEATRRSLTLAEPVAADYIVTAADLGRLRPLSKTWLGKSQQDRLDYETILELVAEKGHAHPLQIRRMNPGVDWNHVTAGQVLEIPAVEYPEPVEKAAFVRIFLRQRALEAFDLKTNVIAHFPVSIAKRVEKRPVGQLHVQVIAPSPNYVFDPDVFPESAEARELGRKLVLPPGPNNPVGVMWIGLDRSGYGIHGTPSPEEVGRTESHGCFRLSNWNAAFLGKLVWVGMPVWVEP